MRAAMATEGWNYSCARTIIVLRLQASQHLHSTTKAVLLYVKRRTQHNAPPPPVARLSNSSDDRFYPGVPRPVLL